MYPTFKLYVYNQNGGRMGTYGPVSLPDRKRAIEFARNVFASTLKNYPGSYVDVEEV